MNPPREDTPVTRPHGLPKIRAVQPSASGMAPAGSTEDATGRKSLEELVGQLMATTAANTQVIEALAVQLGSLTGKLDAHSEASEHRKNEITKAAAHGSNRLALLMGALLTVYEIAAPALHELAKWVQR